MNALANHRSHDNLNPRESLDTKMADKHTISVIGLLKDVEFHIIKGAAEVILTFNVNVVF